MEVLKMNRWTYAFGVSLAITSLVDALIVVLKESNKQIIFSFMQSITGHHWVTQGIVSLILFVALGYVFAYLKAGKGLTLSVNTLLVIIIGAIVLSTVIIVGYFILIVQFNK